MVTVNSNTKTSPLTEKFGVEIHGCDLSRITPDGDFPRLRAMFEEHSALLFRNQSFSDEDHLRLAGMFGPIEDRNADERRSGETFRVPVVSNVRKDGTVSAEMDLHTLNLKSNFLWHSDSTFLPVPALVNILVARIVPTTGGATELASTRAAWAEMPADLREKIKERGIWHRYRHSRKKISEELSRLPMFNKWPDQHWNSTWTNPTNGREALYIASHAFRIDGHDEIESEALLNELTEFCTQPCYVYRHHWQIGDVLIWDQRAVMHRGTPWPYNQPRKLSSICSSAQESDGLKSIRIGQAKA